MKYETLTEAAGKFDIVVTDPPWPYYGSTTKDAAAAKHYDLMTEADILRMPVKPLLRSKQGAVFVWATGPKLDLAIDAIRSWGFCYRGVAFVWVKTRQDGGVIGAQGVPPTATKPTTELVLLGTTTPKGRPFPLLDAAVSQVVMAPRTKHSEKPLEVQARIERLYGDRPRIELFSRRVVEGWSRWGNESPA